MIYPRHTLDVLNMRAVGALTIFPPQDALDLQAYIKHLEEQVTSLQARGTELVEENRKLRRNVSVLTKNRVCRKAL